MKQLPKVDLSILKKLVAELETALTDGEKLAEAEKFDMGEYVVTMSKASGLAAGLAQEGTMLIGDVQAVLKHAQSPSAPKPEASFLDKLLGAGKSTGGKDSN